ncbi:two-component system sensor histidine kinase PilS (NtrC family) [Luteimonas cucumeris]|uniref:histidine kinase n=1 Tax=Luteimonas cucumeris TaxID=985012 RepID=A0A562L5B9_9GAMM|nr:two-component system sensor histidine kinase PilS (NtrC family) [Luteimonas cucumeris]
MLTLRRRPEHLDAEGGLRRELYFFGLYRVLEASLLALLAFGPAAVLVGPVQYPVLVAATAMGYLAAAAVLMIWGRDSNSLRTPVIAGLLVDIVVAALATHGAPQVASGIALMLLFNVGAAALFLPLRLALAAAALAFVVILGQYLWSVAAGGDQRPLAEIFMFGTSYLALATLMNQLGGRMQASEALATQRGVEVANLAEVNELIIRRMRTGVLLVDADGHIRLANEAAQALLGDAGDGRRVLALCAPELARRLQQWRSDGASDNTPLRLGSEQDEVLPRFARLLANSELSLVFLDDTSLLSRRAETITLAALGRFSASLAHEIRNPLAAISYAAQLLEESNDISLADRRMLQIVRQQCVRMNGIVESVLGLARRERANPEHIEVVGLARRFIDEYVSAHPLDDDSLQISHQTPTQTALVDPRHLQQILTVLVSNARSYGRLPGQPARITLRVHHDDGIPSIDVLDRGPGIPDGAADRLFRPFYTTSEHGTGLGLYIARDLAKANEGDLDYIRTPGGSCFRIKLPGSRALLGQSMARG